MDTPGILELVTGAEDRQVVELVLNRMLLGRPFIAPPGVPAERLAVLRAAFRRAVEDPELQSEAQKLKLALDPMWGEEAQEVIKRLYQTPKPVIARTRKIVQVSPEQ